MPTRAGIVSILLTQSEAAALVRAGIDTFRDEVKRGVWPEHILKRGNTKLFDRRAIEQRIDSLSGINSTAPSGEDAALRAVQEWRDRR